MQDQGVRLLMTPSEKGAKQRQSDSNERYGSTGKGWASVPHDKLWIFGYGWVLEGEMALGY